MSVHGEYTRALRGVLERLADCEDLLGGDWPTALEDAQWTPDRDLSSAARAALSLLARLEADLPRATTAADATVPPAVRQARLEPLCDACHHLRAHCRAILGTATDREG